MNESYQRIARLAESSFKSHVLTRTLTIPGTGSTKHLFKQYRCGRQVSSTYMFTLTFIPGSVIMTGDLGDLIVSREPDMIPWLRSVVGRDSGSIDIRYLAEKVPQNITTRVWDEKACHSMIDEAIDQYFGEASDDNPAGGIDYEKRLELHEFDCQHSWEHDVLPKLHDVIPEFYEYGDSQDWCPRFLWATCALRWFVRTLDGNDPNLSLKELT